MMLTSIPHAKAGLLICFLVFSQGKVEREANPCVTIPPLYRAELSFDLGAKANFVAAGDERTMMAKTGAISATKHNRE
jgi:hypothetical protein